MDDLQTNFLQSQSLQPLVWFRYIDDIFFIWTHGNDKLEKFLDDLNSLTLSLPMNPVKTMSLFWISW